MTSYKMSLMEECLDDRCLTCKHLNPMETILASWNVRYHDKLYTCVNMPLCRELTSRKNSTFDNEQNVQKEERTNGNHEDDRTGGNDTHAGGVGGRTADYRD